MLNTQKGIEHPLFRVYLHRPYVIQFFHIETIFMFLAKTLICTILLLKAERRHTRLILAAFYLFGGDFLIRKVQHSAIRYRLTKIIAYKSCRCWIAKIAR